MPVVGDTVQGKLDSYALEELFVDGRFGKTYRARRISDDEDVIVKTIELERSADYHAMEAFERGSDQLRQLQHPTIAPYLDAVVLTEHGQAELGLVQSFVTTPSLRRWASGRGIIDLQACLGWFERALGGLMYLHEQRVPIVHGDLDAGNILISDDGSIKIVDFATVRQALLSPSRLAGGMARGTLDYAPMEQLLGQASPATDIYALAMTFLAVVSGKEPPDFPLDGMRADVEAMLPFGTDDSLVSLLRQMTEPDPNHRLDSARIALERLRGIVRGDASWEEGLGLDDDPDVDQPARPTGPSDLGKRDAILFQLMREVSDLAPHIPDGEAWEEAPDPERERVYAFGIDRDGTHMVLAHKHDATVLGVDNLAGKGQLDFDELARRIAISRDGKRVAILTGFEELLLFDINISIWQRHHIQVEGMWPGNSQLCFSPDADLVAISDDDQVNLYRWDDGGFIQRWDVDGQFGLEFSPDQSLIFAVGEHTTTTIPLDGRELVSFAATGLVFSPDGTMLAVCQGEQVTLGHFRELYPQVTWQHDDRAVPVKGADGARLHLLRFSPNQRHLFVGSSAGFFRLLDVQARAQLEFADPRADDRAKVKIFEVGFSPDSTRLLMHANLAPDEFGTDRMGCVVCFRVPNGEFLGSLLWLDYEPSVMTSQGFYGELGELGSTGFGSDSWERPELVGKLFAGQDVDALLTTEDRASLKEFWLRRNFLERAREAAGFEFDLDDAVKHLACFSHVALEAFRRADTARTHDDGLDYISISKGFGDHLEDACFELDTSYSYEELMTMHHELLERGVGVSVEVPDTARPERRIDQDEADEDDEPMPPAVRPRPSSGRSMSDVPSYKHEHHAPAPTPEPEPEEAHENDSDKFVIALALSVVIAFIPVFAIIVMMGPGLPDAVFWGLLIGVGPALTIFINSFAMKPVFGLK